MSNDATSSVMWLSKWLQKLRDQRKLYEQEQLVFKLKNPNYRKRPAAK